MAQSFKFATSNAVVLTFVFKFSLFKSFKKIITSSVGIKFGTTVRVLVCSRFFCSLQNFRMKLKSFILIGLFFQIEVKAIKKIK